MMLMSGISAGQLDDKMSIHVGVNNPEWNDPWCIHVR